MRLSSVRRLEPGIGGGRVEGSFVLWGLGLVLWAYRSASLVLFFLGHPFGPTSTLGVLNVDPNWTAEAEETTHSIWQSCHWVYGPTLS